ncbi:MAG: diguanylate cyclase [Rubrivivax sp.]|nr:diguanylate cyclase [Rubrivivax sp.]
MNATDADPNATPVAQAEGKLARLGVRVDAMQALLVRLLQDVVQAETRLENTQVARLVEVNQRLVVAAMAHQDNADAAAQALEGVKQNELRDPLTRLPNRTALIDRGQQAIANAKRHGTRLAVLFMDLDNFKQLNDSHGHAFGDLVLCLVADQMRALVREVDTVSRHGGDEFIALLVDVDQPADAHAVADKLIAAIGAPVTLDGRKISIAASIGMALYPEDGSDMATLIASADAAMYEAKRAPSRRTVHGSGSSSGSSSGNDSATVERRHAQLREANERLVLGALTAQDLLAAAERAQARQVALMAAVAEELRNPLAPIRITSAMLGQLPAEQLLLPRVQGIVAQQLSRMSRLVGHLVDASATGPGSWEFERHWTDLGPVIDAAIAAQQAQMEARGQRFESHRPTGVLGVLGDASRLGQVLDNLLDNASRHTHEGGRISLSVVAGSDTLTLTVSDNGIGITADSLPSIFEPFVQDAHALGYNDLGLGIGLTVARALVRAHGGDIVAQSAGARRGSQFIVSLPLVANPDALATALDGQAA